MLLKKILILVIILITINKNVFSQKMENYSANWKKVEAFEKKGLTTSALKEVITIFNLAVVTGNEAQQIKAAMYQMAYRNMVEEDNSEKNIFYIDTLIAKTKIPIKNILQSMKAQMLLNYKENNRYKFYNRTQLVEEKSNDLATWSISKLNATITSLYKVSLKNEAILKATSLSGLEAIIQNGVNTTGLRPTLYDFLAHRALSHFINEENDVTAASYKFILNDEKIFSPAALFINSTFITKDSTSLYYNAILLFQELLKFHLNDTDPGALIDVDLQRLDFANHFGIFTNKDKIYENALSNIETSYAGNPLTAQAGYLRARLYYENGKMYNPLSQKESQFDIKKAKELCEETIAKFPKSEGALNCQNLIVDIKTASLNLETEKVNIPGQPFKSLLKYKNVSTIYLRAIKSSREEIKRIEKNGYDQLWSSMVSLKAVKSWNISLPDQQDFQEHSVEIKTEALDAGTYIILASISPDFSISNNLLARQITYISNISYITNNNDELYILNRDNGLPLANAEVQLWQNTYNNTTRNYEEVKKEKYTSDKNGYISLKIRKDNNYYGVNFQVKYNSDELFTFDTYNSFYNGYENKTTKNTFLFTDRSIYRPGQTVFFKGIVVKRDSATKKSVIINGYKTRVILYDANRQKQGSLELVSNEYGSYNGSFKLPDGGLNGQFYISDSADQAVQYFSVEEYKRPKFSVEVKKPQGTYRVNDSIVVSGNAKAYAGNNIDAAKVTYRVVRKVRYPDWWGWSGYGKRWVPFGNGEEMEITNGETSTNSKGEFFITFKAIPDETVDKKSQPIFNYEVSTDITDINGETRSGSTTVAVAYQALQLNIIADEKLPVDSLKNIKISSSNINNLFERSVVNLTLQKIQSPNKIFRERYWEMPDQFIMSKDEYTKNFPYDAYTDEDKISKWPLLEKVIDITDSTSENSTFKIKNFKLNTGWYKIVVTAKDKYGEDVKAEKYIRLSNDQQTLVEEPLSFDLSNAEAAPGQEINYSIATGFEKIWLIHSVNKVNNPAITSYPVIANTNPFKSTIGITENDRGGINMSYAFVLHNRTYSGNKTINIPWSNKDLKISYETFRDKLLPGS
ncbi:MAG: MG2 domain-containing protein, partial [Ferruginibacter sp.]